MEINPDQKVISELPYFSATEKFEWVQKPDKTGYFLNQLVGLIQSCVIIFLMMAFFYVVSMYAEGSAMNWSFCFVLPSFMLISKLSEWTAIFSITYGITPTQLIIYQKHKTIFLPLSSIKKITINTSNIDRRRSTGTIEIFCGEMEDNDDQKVEKYNYFFNIQAPYQVLALIEKLQRQK